MNALTLNEEVLRNGDWVITDTAEWQRRILLEGMMDKVDWMISSSKGMDAYVEQTRQRVANAQRRYTGDEISTTYLKGAIAEAKAASIKLHTFEQLQRQLNEAYVNITGEDYTPYGRARRSNVRTDAPSDIPADLKAELEALGMPVTLGTTANTNGVDTQEEAV
jgi:hypothetical protein